MTTKHNLYGGTESWLARVTEAALSCLPPAERDSHPFRRHAVWERLAAPGFFMRFPVLWTDDAGRVRADRGLCAAAEGDAPDSVHVTFHPGIDADLLSAQAFLLLLERRLHDVPGGTVLCAVDRSPAGLSDAESMRLCGAVRAALRRIAPRAVLMAPDAPARERGYLHLPRETAFPPARAVGYGAVCLARELLSRAGRGQAGGKTFTLRGNGAEAAHIAASALRLGMWAVPFGEPADVLFLCGGVPPLAPEEAAALAGQGTVLVIETAPLACTPEAMNAFTRAGIPCAPYIAAGGVYAPGPDDAGRTIWACERHVRRRVEAFLARFSSDEPHDLCRALYAAALRAATEELICRGV